MRSLLPLVIALAAACGKNHEPPPPSSGVPGAKPESGPKNQPPKQAGTGAERAKAMFDQLCIMCHGAGGKGDGQMAANLPVKPRDYTDAAWQSSVTDQQIKDIIVKGGAGVGKNQMMPANPDLASDPEKLDGLVQIVRGFGKK
ncbi:MAG: c-type cytochrome [Kofleriaceae bacterium]